MHNRVSHHMCCSSVYVLHSMYVYFYRIWMYTSPFPPMMHIFLFTFDPNSLNNTRNNVNYLQTTIQAASYVYNLMYRVVTSWFFIIQNFGDAGGRSILQRIKDKYISDPLCPSQPLGWGWMLVYKWLLSPSNSHWDVLKPSRDCSYRQDWHKNYADFRYSIIVKIK